MTQRGSERRPPRLGLDQEAPPVSTLTIFVTLLLPPQYPLDSPNPSGRPTEHPVPPCRGSVGWAGVDVLPGRGRNETVSYISCLFVGVLPAWAACCGGAGASQRRGEVEGVGGKGRRGSPPPAKFIFADCSGRREVFSFYYLDVWRTAREMVVSSSGYMARPNVIK